MAVVPNLGRQFVPSNEILKLLLVLRALEEQPVCSRISDSITEHDVQPKRDFVDEVVHVTFQATVVITAKHQTPLAIDEDPTREMNRRHASEMTARVDVSRRVLHQPQESHERPAPEQTWFQTPHRGELVRDVVVFQPRQLIHMFSRRTWRDLRVALLAPSQLDKKIWKIKKNQGTQYQQQDRHKNQVQEFAYSPCQWSFTERSELKAVTVHFLPDELLRR